jgi:hypothetical protein
MLRYSRPVTLIPLSHSELRLQRTWRPLHVHITHAFAIWWHVLRHLDVIEPDCHILQQDSVVIPVADELLATSSWPSSDVRSRHRAATRTTSVHRLARSSRSNLGKVFKRPATS